MEMLRHNLPRDTEIDRYDIPPLDIPTFLRINMGEAGATIEKSKTKGEFVFCLVDLTHDVIHGPEADSWVF